MKSSIGEDVMFRTNRIHALNAPAQILLLLIGCTLPIGVAHSHAQQSQPERLSYGADRANVPDAIARLKSGDFAGIHVDLITRAGAAEAIPALKEQFANVQDLLLKAKIAAALVRLGDKDDTYWDFLVKLATPALESDAPDFISYDSQGKSVPGPSPDFQAWVKAHNSTSDSAGENSFYILPGKVAFLGWSRDPRAIPLLRKGLSSPNHMIEAAAALGLAEIGDADSIPFIVEACKKAPAEAAWAIAEALVYFDDPAAQAAVDQFIPKDVAKIYRDARAQGKQRPMSPPLSN
jgi:HEAT repeat protein